MVFEQPSTLEALQTELAEAIELSNECVKTGKEIYGEKGTRFAVIGILAEARIKRLERMIKAEKKRLKAEEKLLAPKAADTRAKPDAVLAAVTPSSGSYEFEEGVDGC